MPLQFSGIISLSLSLFPSTRSFSSSMHFPSPLFCRPKESQDSLFSFSDRGEGG